MRKYKVHVEVNELPEEPKSFNRIIVARRPNIATYIALKKKYKNVTHKKIVAIGDNTYRVEGIGDVYVTKM